MPWKTDFLGLNYIGNKIDRSILDIKEWSTKRTEKTAYLIVGSTLARVLIEATRNEVFDKAGMSCKVLEIDGEIIPLDEQNEKKATISFINNIPTQQEQMRLLVKVLDNFNILGRPATVSDDYARGHIRMLGMKTRLTTKEKEAERCS